MNDCPRCSDCPGCGWCIGKIYPEKNTVIWKGSQAWEEERLRLLRLPPLVHEVMLVNLVKGAVRCQVMRLGHSDPQYNDCCRIVVPPWNVKVKDEDKRKCYNHIPQRKLLRGSRYDAAFAGAVARRPPTAQGRRSRGRLAGHAGKEGSPGQS